MEEEKINRHKYDKKHHNDLVKHSNHGHDSPNKYHSHGDTIHQYGNDSPIKHHSHHTNSPSLNLNSTTSKFIDEANM